MTPNEPTDIVGPDEPEVRRYTSKLWDWDAFPASRGYPELARAQMRFIGAGGSPKVGDVSTLEAHTFTCSLLYQEPHRYAAVHTHEIEEIFLIHQGRMTVSWEFDGELVDVVLGPGDALVNPAGRAHGFRNDGPGPILAQFMVGHPKPMLPKYKSHPSSGDSDPRFGADLPDPTDPRAKEMARYVVRAGEAPTVWVDSDAGGSFAVQPYVSPLSRGGVVEPGHFALHMLHLAPGAATPTRAWDYEVAVMVAAGQLEVTLGDPAMPGVEVRVVRLGALDLLRVSPGVPATFANRGPMLISAVAVLGTDSPDLGHWEANRVG